jgi:putative NADH-flavin reductase
MHPGITTGRTGSYRLGIREPSFPFFNTEGRSSLSVQDLVVIADEIENPNIVKFVLRSY